MVDDVCFTNLALLIKVSIYLQILCKSLQKSANHADYPNLGFCRDFANFPFTNKTGYNFWHVDLVEINLQLPDLLHHAARSGHCRINPVRKFFYLVTANE